MLSAERSAQISVYVQLSFPVLWLSPQRQEAVACVCVCALVSPGAAGSLQRTGQPRDSPSNTVYLVQMKSLSFCLLYLHECASRKRRLEAWIWPGLIYRVLVCRDRAHVPGMS